MNAVAQIFQPIAFEAVAVGGVDVDAIAGVAYPIADDPRPVHRIEMDAVAAILGADLRISSMTFSSRLTLLVPSTQIPLAGPRIRFACTLARVASRWMKTAALSWVRLLPQFVRVQPCTVTSGAAMVRALPSPRHRAPPPPRN